MRVSGSIIYGEIDPLSQEFTLQSVKQLETNSVLNKDQIELMYQYIQRQNLSDGQVVSLNDQILVNLNENELQELHNDLEKILIELNSTSKNRGE